MAEKSNNVAAATAAAASTLCVVKRGRERGGGKSEEDRESGLGGRGLCEQANLLCCRSQLISARRPLKSEHATLLWQWFVVRIHPWVISARDKAPYHRSTYNSADLSQVKSDSTSTSLRSVSIFHATPLPSLPLSLSIIRRSERKPNFDRNSYVTPPALRRVCSLINSCAASVCFLQAWQNNGV